MTEVRSKASRMELPVSEVWISGLFLDFHDSVNGPDFPPETSLPSVFRPFVSAVYRMFGKPEPAVLDTRVPSRAMVPGKKVLLGLSGGLDSVSQILLLKDAGYDVTPFSMFNVNWYANGQENKAVEAVCAKLGLDLVKARFVPCFDKANPYRKIWPENPVKNQMIMAAMADWCIENGVGLISMGDDLGLPASEAVPGVNATDAREITVPFIDGLKALSGIGFVPMDRSVGKLDRIRLLRKAGLQDDFYSCVLPGKFNRMRHEGNQKKFGISLFGRNCGCSCRKCAMHNLILHYSGDRPFPPEFVKACWKTLCSEKSADRTVFPASASEDELVRRLFSY